MINMLVLKPKWEACKPETRRLDNVEHHVMGVFFRIRDLVNVITFYYDEEIYNLGKQQALDKLFITAIDNDLDLVLLNVYPFGIETNLQLETIFKLKKLLDIPFVFTWWDSVWPDENVHLNIMGWYENISNLNIYLDTYKYMPDNGKSEFWPCIYDSAVFEKKDNLIRDIDVCFNGTINKDRPKREHMLQILNINNINIFTQTSNISHSMPLKEYANIYQRSKISLHVSDDIFRLNGRVFEAKFAGSLLFHDFNKSADMFFENGKHYIMYEDDCDLLDKIEYYLEHDEEREKIAQAGYERAIELCEPNKYWSRVFNRVGIM